MPHRRWSAFDLGLEEIDIQAQGCLLIFRCGCRYVVPKRYEPVAVYCVGHGATRRRGRRREALVA
jgi:hypothetical protein